MEEEKTTTPEEETPEEEKKPDLFAETIKTLKQQNDELKLALNDLKKQYGDMKEIDLQDKGLRSFDRIAREYKVQYAVYKTAKGQYQIFFKAPSEASMNAAFQKYSKNRLKKEQRRESVLGKLKKFKELVKAPVPNREKRREQER